MIYITFGLTTWRPGSSLSLKLDLRVFNFGSVGWV